MLLQCKSVLLRTFGFRTRDSDCNCSSFTVSDILKNKPIYLPAILHFFSLQKRSTFAAGPNLHRNLTEPWKTDEYGYKVCVAHSITNQGNSFGKWYWIIVRLLWHINVWSILLLLLKCFAVWATLWSTRCVGEFTTLFSCFHNLTVGNWFLCGFLFTFNWKKPLDSVFWNVTVHRINMRWNRKKWSTCMEKVCVTKMDWNAILKSILDGDAVWKQN